MWKLTTSLCLSLFVADSFATCAQRAAGVRQVLVSTDSQEYEVEDPAATGQTRIVYPALIRKAMSRGRWDCAPPDKLIGLIDSFSQVSVGLRNLLERRLWATYSLLISRRPERAVPSRLKALEDRLELIVTHEKDLTLNTMRGLADAVMAHAVDEINRGASLHPWVSFDWPLQQALSHGYDGHYLIVPPDNRVESLLALAGHMTRDEALYRQFESKLKSLDLHGPPLERVRQITLAMIVVFHSNRRLSLGTPLLKLALEWLNSGKLERFAYADWETKWISIENEVHEHRLDDLLVR